jgi:hypothetical protein
MKEFAMAKMRAAIFVEPGRSVLGEKPIPEVGLLDALLRIITAGWRAEGGNHAVIWPVPDPRRLICINAVSPAQAHE